MHFLSNNKRNCIQENQLDSFKDSDTRWACRQSAINAICHVFDAILATLEQISTGCDSSRAIEARGLLAQVKSFHFLLCAIMFDRVLTCAKHLSDLLQCPKLEFGKAGDVVSSTIETIEMFRSDEEWDKLFSYCKDAYVAKLYNTRAKTFKKRK